MSPRRSSTSGVRARASRRSSSRRLPRRASWTTPQYDTTSILKFIETRWDLAPLGTRDAAANNLTNAFTFPAGTPGMPTTGQGNAVDLWAPVGAGVLLALAGLALRRRSTARG